MTSYSGMGSKGAWPFYWEILKSELGLKHVFKGLGLDLSPFERAWRPWPHACHISLMIQDFSEIVNN